MTEQTQTETLKNAPAIIEMVLEGDFIPAGESFPLTLEMRLSADVNLALAEINNAVELKVENNEQYEAGIMLARKLAGFAKLMDAERKTITSPLDNIKAAIKAYYDAKIDRANTLSRQYLSVATEYDRAIKAEQAKQQALADQRAREEREKAEAKAAKLIEKGKDEQADAVLQNAAQTVAPTVSVAPEKAKGVYDKKTYTAEVVDVIALMKEVIAGKCPPTVFKVDQAGVNKLAAQWKEGLSIAGLKLKVETQTIVRSANPTV